MTKISLGINKVYLISYLILARHGPKGAHDNISYLSVFAQAPYKLTLRNSQTQINTYKNTYQHRYTYVHELTEYINDLICIKTCTFTYNIHKQ